MVFFSDLPTDSSSILYGFYEYDLVLVLVYDLVLVNEFYFFFARYCLFCYFFLPASLFSSSNDSSFKVSKLELFWSSSGIKFFWFWVLLLPKICPKSFLLICSRMKLVLREKINYGWNLVSGTGFFYEPCYCFVKRVVQRIDWG